MSQTDSLSGYETLVGVEPTYHDFADRDLIRSVTKSLLLYPDWDSNPRLAG